MLISEQDYLEHHGVKGMKWYQHIFGKEQSHAKYSKKGRGELIKAHTIEKGTKMYRSTIDPNETLDGAKYVTYIDIDRDLYRGKYSSTIKSHAGKSSSDRLYEKEYKLTEDLKIPSRETLQQAYSNVMANDKTKKQAIEGYISSLFNRDKVDYMLNYDNWEEVLNKDIKNWTDKTMTEWNNYSVQECFAITARSLASSNPAVKQAVINQLKSQGYNAMVDEAGVGGLGGTKREGIEPLIIFDGKSVMKETSVNVVSDQTNKQATSDYVKWYNKVNSLSNKKKTW